jgi:hypothetical protein
MAGEYTNGRPLVQALVQNGVTITPVPLTNLPNASALLPADVPQPGGQQPITVAATAFQVAAAAAAMITNTVTSTVHTGTLNTTEGLMVTEALTTAAGATYTFQLVNSLIVSAATPAPEVQMKNGTNTAGAAQVTSITNAAGTCTVVFTNTGTAAWNGTMLIPFHV